MVNSELKFLVTPGHICVWEGTELARPTLAHIAQEAGTAISTVSRVLSGKETKVKISHETRERIIQIARALDYQPNMAARTLAAREARALGVVLRDPERIKNPHISEIVAGISRVADERELPLVWYFQQGEKLSPLSLLGDRRVDGGIVLEDDILPDSEIEAIARSDFPLVLMGPYPQRDGLHLVASDDDAGMEAAVDHVVAQGARRLAHLGSTRHWAGFLRQQGFLRACERHGLSEEARVHEVNWRPAEAEKIVEQEQRGSDPPTAYLCSNDLLALAAISGVHKAKRRVPEDVLVVGFNDSVFAQYNSPSLTTVRRPLVQMGKEACHLLCALAYEKADDPPSVILPTQLIVRQSSVATNAACDF